MGVGFLLLSAAGFLLVVNDTNVVRLRSVVVAALAIVGSVLGRTTGLPEFRDHVGQWMYPLGVVSLVGEALMLGPELFNVAKSRWSNALIHRRPNEGESWRRRGRMGKPWDDDPVARTG